MFNILLFWLGVAPTTLDPVPTIPTISLEAPCEIRGFKATCKSVWSKGLHATHFEQRYVIRDRETGDRFFEGHGIYRLSLDGNVDGVWADSNGNIHPLEGTWNGKRLVIHWGTPETEQGRSDYRFGENGTLKVEDRVLRPDGDWRLFMKVDYSAQPNIRRTE